MKRALISDIHGNLDALEAVLEDIRDQGVTEICCLGDVIGYGPDPCPCLDRVIDKCSFTILGNHDQAALFDPDGFNPVALRAVYWTRDQLDNGPGGATRVNLRWDFLGELPRTHVLGEGEKFLFVHGSPREPTNEYVFPEDVYNGRKMSALFARFKQYCFQGHTHIPGIFTASLEFISPEDCDYRYQLSEQSMINVGSVGQPRDGDPRSCYVILDEEEETVTFRRVDYPVDKVAQKIYEIDNLDNMLGDRLRSGR